MVTVRISNHIASDGIRQSLSVVTLNLVQLINSGHKPSDKVKLMLFITTSCYNYFYFLDLHARYGAKEIRVDMISLCRVA